MDGKQIFSRMGEEFPSIYFVIQGKMGNKLLELHLK